MVICPTCGAYMSDVKEWPKISPPELLVSVCGIRCVEIEDARSRSRDPYLVKTRAIYFYLGKTIWDFELSLMGRYVDRDHSDVIHHLKKYKEAVKSHEPWYDHDLDMEIRRIKAKILDELISCE